jgi:hypothetical protein
MELWSTTSCMTIDPLNVCVSWVGSNVQPQGPDSAIDIAGPVHAIDTLVTSASAIIPLPPPSTTHVCSTGLVATVTVYDAPGSRGSAKLNMPFAGTVSNALMPLAWSRSATPSAPAQSPRTRPPT